MHNLTITTIVVSSNPLMARCTDTTLSDKACQWLAGGRWFCTVTPAFSINTTDYNDITSILLKVAFNTITRILTHQLLYTQSNVYGIGLRTDVNLFSCLWYTVDEWLFLIFGGGLMTT